MFIVPYISHDINTPPITVFILIEARRASAGMSPSEMVLISPEKTIIVIKTLLTPLYITSFHCCMTY